VVLRKNPKVNPNRVKRKFGLTFYHGDLDSFDIELKPVNGASKAEVKRALKNSETFKIEELYNRHKDMVIEMVQNTILYDDSYVNSLFKKFGGSLFGSKEDVLRLITKNYITDDDVPKRPFSKFSRDIHNEFGLKY
jgi:hypothetical protein